MAKKANAKATAPAKAPASKAAKINVHHLTRVEGHGNIVVEIDEKGTVTTCRWEVPEAPRFFEAMLIGRGYRDVHHITSRICGICSVGHQLASLQATEDALDVRVSEQTLELRRLALHGENMQSHLLHIAYLVLPDLMGVDSVIPLAATHRDAVLKLIAARKMSNEFCITIGGRIMHPQRMTPGGWTKFPAETELKRLRGLIVEALPNLEFAADLLASLADRIPDFKRPTEYIALVAPNEYAMYWGEVGSNLDERHPARHYKHVTREYCVPQSTAKWSKNIKDSYMVGALARFNLNAEKLTPGAAKVAAKLGLKKGCTNPYMNSVAQLVECVHSSEDSIAIIDRLLSKGIRDEAPAPVKAKAGKGVGAVEVPRGILFHSYEYDDNGRIFSADCVIPTNQNHANIQKDMDALVPTLVGKSEAEIELILSMLVRAYDPCISCSTHTVDLSPGPGKSLVRFVRGK